MDNGNNSPLLWQVFACASDSRILSDAENWEVLLLALLALWNRLANNSSALRDGDSMSYRNRFSSLFLILAVVSMSLVIAASAFASPGELNRSEEHAEGELIVVFDGYSMPEAKQAVLDELGYESLEEIETVWNPQSSILEEVCLVRVPSIPCSEAASLAVSHDCVIEAYGNPFYGHEIGGTYIDGVEGRDFEAGAILVRFADGITASEAEDCVSSFGASLDYSGTDLDLLSPVCVLLPDNMSVAFGILHAENDSRVVSASYIPVMRAQGSSPYKAYLVAIDGGVSAERCETLMAELDAVGTLRFRYPSGSAVYHVLTDSVDFSERLSSALGSDLLQCRIDEDFGRVVGCRVVDLHEGFDCAEHELVVGFADGTDLASIEACIEGVGALGETFLESDSLVYLVSLPEGCSVADGVAYFSKSNAVEYVEPNWFYGASYVPNDPGWLQQYNLKLANVPNAWDLTQPVSTVKVAVLDTGIDQAHEDLAGRLDLTNARNFASDGLPSGDIHPRNSHGTHVAGIVAAQIDNGVGVAGVAPDAQILPINVFRFKNGEWLASDADLAAALEYVGTVEGVKVVNLSLSRIYGSSWGDHQQNVANAVSSLNAKGILIVAAAGNNGSDERVFPGDLPECVSVINIDGLCNRYGSSSFGPDKDICAPGVNIVSTVPEHLSGTKYGNMTGTSMSAPVVAGVAAILYSNNPSLTSDEVKAILYSTAADLGAPGFDVEYANGMVDAGKAVGCLNYPVTEYCGYSKYDTAAMQAEAAFPQGCPSVIVVSAESWADGLVASGLAGALGCPVLLSGKEFLPDSTAECITRMGCEQAYVIGGAAVVTAAVESELSRITGSPVVRLAGDYSTDTARIVCDYGTDRGLWSGEMALVSTNRSFYDALSLSPLAVSRKAPILLANSAGTLPEASWDAVSRGSFASMVFAGGEAVISAEALSRAESVCGAGGAVRIAGGSFYETSAAIAEWCCSEGLLGWDGVAFSSGNPNSYSDALCGGVLQGRKGSVMLLMGDTPYSSVALANVKAHASEIFDISFFGGEAVMPGTLRYKIVSASM